MHKFVLILAFAVAVFAQAKDPSLEINGDYYISEVALEFIQAYATCKRYGWSLATEKTPEDTLRINAALQAVGAISSVHFVGGFRQVDGLFYPSWIWLESGEEFNYTNWYNNVESDTYNCLIKQSITNYGGNWTSASCTSQYYFICQTS